ncbi:MAG: CoA transferase [Polaromonas sp.]|nr:CoA transferase [Polaromonas sp.]
MTQAKLQAKTQDPALKIPQVLKGVRLLSLALNLPGPAALMRCQQMGARCVKLEPPSGDPMQRYSPPAYAQLQSGIKVITVDLKTEAGQKKLHRELAKTYVLITSFRPSAIEKLGLGWKNLHRLYPALSQVAIVGSPGARAEEPGHDLTYLADSGLVPGLELPATLYADMGGSLAASEAVLQAVLSQRNSGKGIRLEVALSSAAHYLALPRHWGLTQPSGFVGGAHAGYRVYACKDGRVAVAALEPHFAAALCAAAGLPASDVASLQTKTTRDGIARFLKKQTRQQLDVLATLRDIPLHTMA